MAPSRVHDLDHVGLRYSPTYSWTLGKRFFLAAPKMSKKDAEELTLKELGVKAYTHGLLQTSLENSDSAYFVASKIVNSPGFNCGVVEANLDNGYFNVKFDDNLLLIRVRYRAPYSTKRLVTIARRNVKLLTPDELLVIALVVRRLGARRVRLLSSRLSGVDKASWDPKTQKWLIDLPANDLEFLALEYSENEDLVVYPLSDGYLVAYGANPYSAQLRSLLIDATVLGSWCRDPSHLSERHYY